MIRSPQSPIIKPSLGRGLNPRHPFYPNIITACVFNELSTVETTPPAIDDISQYHNTGTIAGIINHGQGPFGRVLNFNGTTNFVTLPFQPYQDTLTRITILARVKCTGTTGAQTIVNRNFNGSNVPYHLGVGQTGGVTAGMATEGSGTWHNTGVNTSIYNDGKWHIVGGTYDGANLSYWLDGRLDATLSYTGGLFTNAGNVNPIDIGDYRSDAAVFSGDMDFVLILNRAISAQEMQEFYLNPARVFSTDPFPKAFSVALSSANISNFFFAV